jgi:NAD(P)-dependent dehydrogenase (short-subunit alcohol dehydrogenase family)
MGVLNLSLSDRTAVVAGPFGPLVQNLASTLSENGADVAMVVAPEELNMAQRFCQNLMDLREVSEKYGRSAAIDSQLKDEKSVRDAFSRSAELFGTTDMYIDTHLVHTQIPFATDLPDPGHLPEVRGAAEKSFDQALDKVRLASTTALSFIRNRSRSRLLVALNDLDLTRLKQLGSNRGEEFSIFVKSLAREVTKNHITVNALAIGASEDYLLNRHRPKSMSIQKELKDLQVILPQLRLVDYADVSATISFMISPLSSALNGQVVALNHGL